MTNQATLRAAVRVYRRAHNQYASRPAAGRHGWHRGANAKVIRRDAREAEGAPLLREYRVKSSIEGSNPSLSAIHAKAAFGRLLHVWLRSSDCRPAPAARALIGTTNLRFVSGAASPLSLRLVRQGRRKAALSCLAEIKRFPARASGAGAHRHHEPAVRKRCRLAPLSPPGATRPPKGGFVVSGGDRAIACPRQRRGRSSGRETCLASAGAHPFLSALREAAERRLRRTWLRSSDSRPAPAARAFERVNDARVGARSRNACCREARRVIARKRHHTHDEGAWSGARHSAALVGARSRTMDVAGARGASAR